MSTNSIGVEIQFSGIFVESRGIESLPPISPTYEEAILL